MAQRLVVGIWLFIIALAGCAPEPMPPDVVHESPPPPPAPKPKPPLNLGKLPTPAESVFARPARESQGDRSGALLYAPRGEGLIIKPATVGETTLDRDLEGDLLLCHPTERGDSFYGLHDPIVERAGDPGHLRAVRPWWVLAQRFSLPLWSMRRGETVTMTFERNQGDAVVVRGTFDGKLPLLAKGAGTTIACHLVSPEEVARVATEAHDYAEEQLTYEETHPRAPDISVADPYEGSFPLSTRAISELAGYVGWSHPLVTPLLARLDALAKTLKKGRDVAFEAAAGQAAADGVLAPKVRAIMGAKRCSGRDTFQLRDAGTVIIKGLLTMGMGGPPRERGCGVEVEVVNESDEAVEVGAVYFIIATKEESTYAMTEVGAPEKPPTRLAPKQKWSGTVYTRLDVSKMAPGPVLLVVKAGDKTVPLGRIR